MRCRVPGFSETWMVTRSALSIGSSRVALVTPKLSANRASHATSKARNRGPKGWRSLITSEPILPIPTTPTTQDCNEENLVGHHGPAFSEIASLTVRSTSWPVLTRKATSLPTPNQEAPRSIHRRMDWRS